MKQVLIFVVIFLVSIFIVRSALGISTPVSLKNILEEINNAGNIFEFTEDVIQDLVQCVERLEGWFIPTEEPNIGESILDAVRFIAGSLMIIQYVIIYIIPIIVTFAIDILKFLITVISFIFKIYLYT